MYVQSEEISTDVPISEGGVSQHEIITFADVGAAAPLDIGSYLTNVFSGEQDVTASLGEYLSRPVKIQSLTWTEGVSFSQSFNPWHNYFNNVYIKRKLDNYSRLRCKLKVKFVLNSSPFYYGNVRASYRPMQHPFTYTGPESLIQLSQMPGVYLEPSKMSTVEMTLPFLWTSSWLNVSEGDELSALGSFVMEEFWPLSSANGVVGTGITISVYAWAEDVVLAAPTLSLAVQSDEYADRGLGTISGPATAVAGYANILSSVPIIGNFAKATSIGANAVASIAKLFGYSNPPVIDDVHGFHPKSFHAFANVETRMPIDRLCIDPKNEVTIDNTVCDIDSADSLSFDNTIMRESLVTTNVWEGADAPNTALFTGSVGPAYQRSIAELNQSRMIMTPVSYFGKMFQLWRGSLIYKFKFIKTQYHKGRVAISWDPNTNVTGVNGLETAIFTRIVDLEFEDEVEIEIPYKAKTPYLQVAHGIDVSTSSTPTFPFSLTDHNGTFTVRVLNVLTGPTVSPNVGILLYMRPGEDFRFSRPRSITRRQTVLPVQSGDINIAHNAPTADSAIDLITVGETLVSLRPLLHRTSFSHIEPLGQNKIGTSSFAFPGTQFTTNILSRVPKPYGYTSEGVNWANSIITPLTALPFSFTAPHPMRWTLECFVGYRGSTNIHINPIVSGVDIGFIDSVSASRYYTTDILNPTLQHRNRFTSTILSDQDSQLAKYAVVDGAGGVQRKNNGQSGMTLTNTNTQSALSMNVPQYIWTRFNTAPFVNATKTWSGGDNIFDNVEVNATFQTATAGSATKPWPCMEVYYSAGVDFNPVFFVCVPVVYIYAEPTTDNDYTP